MALKSRLPKIAAELATRMDAATGAVAERVEQKAKDRAPVNTGKLRAAIHTERQGVSEHMVIAGNADVFYGHIVEHGGAFTAPRPFLTPAAEEARSEAVGIVKAMLRGLG